MSLFGRQPLDLVPADREFVAVHTCDAELIGKEDGPAGAALVHDALTHPINAAQEERRAHHERVAGPHPGLPHAINRQWDGAADVQGDVLQSLGRDNRPAPGRFRAVPRGVVGRTTKQCLTAAVLYSFRARTLEMQRMRATDWARWADGSMVGGWRRAPSLGWRGARVAERLPALSTKPNERPPVAARAPLLYRPRPV